MFKLLSKHRFQLEGGMGFILINIGNFRVPLKYFQTRNGKKEKWYDSYYELQCVSIDKEYAKKDEFFLYLINKVDTQKFITLPIYYNLTLDEVRGFLKYFLRWYDDICFVELEHNIIEVGNGINNVTLY